MIKAYFSLTKFGLVLGNVVPLLAGFALGSGSGPGQTAVIFVAPLFAITAIGLMLVMASGCVFNNYIDRDIDGAMARTRDRVLVTSSYAKPGVRNKTNPVYVSPRAALAFGTTLGALGFLALILFTNALAVGAALLGFFLYVFLYSAWWKRRSVGGTLVGAFAGATPPLVGYAAASGRVDLAAAILFFMLIFWQMAHFYAIAIRRRDDYAAAKIPVLPVRHGVRATKIQMLFYIAAFTLTAPLLAIYGYLHGSAGRGYGILALLLGVGWLALGMRGFATRNETGWAKNMFLMSLVVMVMLFGAMTLAAVK